MAVKQKNAYSLKNNSSKVISSNGLEKCSLYNSPAFFVGQNNELYLSIILINLKIQ